MNGESGYNSPRRIALIRPSALGDVCRTVPTLVSLRRAFPDATIDWIVQDQFASAVSAHPDLNDVVPFARDRFARFGRSIEATSGFVRWSRSLRQREYDLVFDLQGLARSGFIAWLTGAPHRVGFANAREGASIAYTRKHHIDERMHTVDRMLALLEANGIDGIRDMRLYVPPAAAEWWREQRERLDLSVDRYAVLAPTARWESKRWPADRFAALIGPLRHRGFEHVVVVGGASERAQCQAIFDHEPSAIDLVGATDIGQLLAVIAGAGLVIANDSAALHMAVGFDRRYVALYGPTDVRLVGPYGGERRVVQRIASDERLSHKDASLGSSIMERIDPADVLGKVDEVISDQPLEPSVGVNRGDAS